MATASLVTLTSLQNPRELSVLEFRAPPPSPVTGVLTSSSSGSSGHGDGGDGNDDDEIGRFLHRSARVPALHLPERAFPRRKKVVWAPLVIDMRLLASPETGGPVAEALRSAAASFGCFQVVGHEIDGDLVSKAFGATKGTRRSPALEEMECVGGGEDGDDELWRAVGEGNQEMTGNWLLRCGVNQFRDIAEHLCSQLEQTAAKILDALQQGSDEAIGSSCKADRNGSLLCIRKHHIGGGGAEINHDDILRMLIRNSRCSRALALHLCPGASAFHIFSPRGWSRFHPADHAIVVTVGDQVQAWSDGLYKSVAGKPVYGNGGPREAGPDAVSMEFLHSCSPVGTMNEPRSADVKKIIPLSLQVTVAACLVLAYHFVLPCLYALW